MTTACPSVHAFNPDKTNHPQIASPNGNWGSGFIFFHFSDTNLVNFAEAFFSSRDKTMLWMTLHTLAAFFMPRFSAIHAWDTVVFFHSNPASSTLAVR